MSENDTHATGGTVPADDASASATATPAPAPPAAAAPEVPAADELTTRLLGLGLSQEQIGNLRTNLGLTSVDELSLLTETDLREVGVLPIPARRVMAALQPAAPAAAAPPVDPTAELPEGAEPTRDQVTGFASNLGIDPMMLFALSGMGGGGTDFDLSGMLPIATLVNGYNPKRRDLFLNFMGHLERRLGVPIVVIDGDGSINRPLTVEYIEGLEEGRDAAENNIYFDVSGVPHEVIRVGVDAQSIYDADPLDSTKALQKNGMGIGRVQWHNVPLEVRQVAYFAVTVTREIDPTNDAHLTWLRDHMRPGTNRLTFHGQAPQAITQYNEAARTGSLPTLRVMLSRNPRRAETMPRRRRTSPTDLSGLTRIGDGYGHPLDR